MSSTLPRPAADWAWFLDLDGTLIDIAPVPGDVHVPATLVPSLQRIRQACGGALAVVSGRPLISIYQLLHPLDPAAAGLHGLARMRAGEIPDAETPPDPRLDPVRAAFAAFVAANPGTMLEDKGVMVALHYRQAPDRQEAARVCVEAALAALPDFHGLAGKMVFEVRPSGVHKGTAIRTFMGQPPFSGRRPVFFGDDVTDEDGFAMVNQMEGISVLVGDHRATLARYRIESAAALRQFLQQAAFG